jgi:hypothetical protein
MAAGFRHLVRYFSRRRAQNVSVQFLQPVKFSHPRKPYMTPTLTTSSDSHTTQINGRDLTADHRKAIHENVRETKL